MKIIEKKMIVNVLKKIWFATKYDTQREEAERSFLFAFFFISK